ncbi:MAG: cyclic nucleotide-binding domain-containing protein [Verrucomicrobiae bacterium]|nr:cyclic nucleotide-binding domain-containing protein [Verrucomicrobiae bacterium]
MSTLLQLVETVTFPGRDAGGFPRLLVPHGQVVFRENDPGDCLYVVRRGRLRVLQHYNTPRQRLLGEVGHGECVGEMALLGGSLRSATVVAIRDSELIQVAQKDFDRLIREHPQPMLDIMRVITRRLDTSNRPAASAPQRLTLAVIPASESVPLSWFCQTLRDCLSANRPACLLQSQTLPAELAVAGTGFSDGDRRLAHWLDEQEQLNSFLILQGETALTAWRRRCLRQADIVIVLGTAREDSELTTLKRELTSLSEPAARPRLELVLVHEQFPCSGTQRWLEALPVAGHHHIRLDSVPDVARVARIFLGQDVTLVLGGGGARGFAEIGVLKAIEELRIPVDRVGGTSMGAVIGGHFALHQDWRRAVADMRRSFVEGGRLHDYTLPLQSIIRAARYERLLANLFGEIQIEDLPLSFFCMSCNLTQAASVIHRQGPLSKWLGASVSIPGMAPPLVDQGELYVDGGFLNNLPVDVAREAGAGYVIAVDVSPEVDLKLSGGFQGRPSGWEVAANWLRHRQSSEQFPSMFDVMLRTTEMTSVSKKNQVRALADCCVRPTVQGFKMFDWHAIEDLVERGYQAAMATLPALREKLPSLPDAGDVRSSPGFSQTNSSLGVLSGAAPVSS